MKLRSVLEELGNNKVLLVGDNPFHNISHLTQERTRLRDSSSLNPERAANLVHICLENGATGFMFSVSDTTLSILKSLRSEGDIERLDLYAIVPYAYEYVRLATQIGGIPGLARVFARRILSGLDFRSMLYGLNGILRMDVVSLLKTYLLFELRRLRSSAGKRAKIRSMLLHEVVTDLALALNLDWFFQEYINYVSCLHIKPGFNTCNFAYLLNKLKEWEIASENIVIATPFNKVGFQMNPSKMECEKALKTIGETEVIAISILAAGYLKPMEAIDYIASLPRLKGVVVGVSKEKHVFETFGFLRERLM